MHVHLGEGCAYAWVKGAECLCMEGVRVHVKGAVCECAPG